jgi:VWFA-related protein
MKTKTFLAMLLSVCVFLPVLAQTPAPPQSQKDDKDDVVRISTNLVQVDAVVTKDGKVVRDLTADDFEIYEDGRKQTITNFAFISNVPNNAAQPATKEKTSAAVPVSPLKRDDPRRTIALVVDDLGLSAESMGSVRKQLRKFIAEELQPNDLVAIIRTGGELGALQQFTNDKRVLNRAVDRLRWNFCSRVGISVFPRLTAFPHDDSNHCGGMSIYSTTKALRFILDALEYIPGRKSMVLFSDSLPRQDQMPEMGEDFMNRLDASSDYSFLLQRVAEKAIRSSVVIYSVDTQGLQYTGPTAADHFAGSGRNISSTSMQAIMSSRSDILFYRREGGELIARQTGGFQVRNSNDFGLDRILEDQSGYYLLGYRPTDETFNRRFHHIKAKVKKSGMSLRTRYGFFGVSEEEVGPNPLSPGRDTNLALASPFGAQDIEVNLASFFTNDKVSGSVVRSFVYIDAKDLKFENVEDRHQASIELHGVIFGDNGKVVEQLTRGATLSLNEGDYEQAMRNGMALRFDMPVKKPGAYQVRIATRDRVSSKIGSAGQFVDVPNLNNKKLAVSGMVLGTTARFAGRDVSEIVENPGTRFFEPNSELHFAFVAYNAASAGNLVMETKLFRDAKIVYSGPESPLQIGNQPDPNRVLINGSVRLSPELEPGNYYIQVVITDKSAKGKAAPVVQWIDFDIVK